MSLPIIIAQTDLIATVPQAIADFFANWPEVVQLKLPFAPPTFQANLYWGKSVHQDPRNKWLRQQLASAFETVRQRDYARNGSGSPTSNGRRVSIKSRCRCMRFRT
jgi:DNA-binding transcriptional LysR family regulator